MDPETRKVHATMLVIRRTALIAASTVLSLYALYAVFGSGFDCEAEAKLVQERATKANFSFSLDTENRPY